MRRRYFEGTPWDSWRWSHAIRTVKEGIWDEPVKVFRTIRPLKLAADIGGWRDPAT
jgi:hypothetical protein